jgi:hypothetical protein
VPSAREPLRTIAVRSELRSFCGILEFPRRGNHSTSLLLQDDRLGIRGTTTGRLQVPAKARSSAPWMTASSSPEARKLDRFFERDNRHVDVAEVVIKSWTGSRAAIDCVASGEG